MNELKPINKQTIFGKPFTIYGTLEEPLFLAKDVATWIEHTDVSMMLRNIDEDEKVTSIVCTLGGNQEAWFLTEHGLYEILMQSRKPIARQFKKRVKEILTEIRLTGGFNVPRDYKTALRAYADEIEKTEALSAKIEREKPYTDLGKSIAASDDAIKIGDFAKLLCKNGLMIGRNNLFDWLRMNKYLMDGQHGYSRNEPYQRFIDAGYFEIKETTHERNGTICISTTTLITPKGQQYFAPRIKEGFRRLRIAQ
jgi:anti-repressor protein